jgi:hypothetical protein
MRHLLLRRFLVPVLLCAGSVCCTSEAAPEPEPPATRPPQPACDQARSTLERRSRDGAFLFEESGTAMVSVRDWTSMNQSSRDRLMETLAVIAGCTAASPQREVEVTVRSETGTVLTSRRLRPSRDFRI